MGTSALMRPKQLWLQSWGNHQGADLSHNYVHPGKDGKSGKSKISYRQRESNTLYNIGQALARSHAVIPHRDSHRRGGMTILCLQPFLPGNTHVSVICGGIFKAVVNRIKQVFNSDVHRKDFARYNSIKLAGQQC